MPVVRGRRRLDKVIAQTIENETLSVS